MLAAATTAALALGVVGSGAAQAETRTSRVVSDPALTADASFAGTGGSSVYYETSAPALYRTSGGTSALVVAGDVSVKAVSADGTRVLVRTEEALVPADTDRETDVYRLDTSTTPATPFLVSSAGNGIVDFDAASPDLTRVVYSTRADAVHVADGTAAPTSLGTGTTFNAASTDAQAIAFARNGVVQRIIGDPTGTPTTINASYVGALSADGLSGWASTNGSVGYFSSGPSATPVTPTTVAWLAGYAGVSADQQYVYTYGFSGLSRYDRSGGSVLLAAPAGGSFPSLLAVTPDGGAVYSTQALGQAESLFRASSTGVSTSLTAGLSGTFELGAVTSAGTVFFDATDAQGAPQGVYAVDSAGVRTQVAPGALFGGSTADGSRVWYDAGSPARVHESTVVPASQPPTTSPATPTTPTTPAPPSADTTAPTAAVKARRLQRNDGTVEVRVTCTGTEACTVSGRATIAAKTARGARKYVVAVPTTTIAAGQQRVVAVELGTKVRTAVAAALRKRATVKALVALSAADAVGNARPFRVTVRLR